MSKRANIPPIKPMAKAISSQTMISQQVIKSGPLPSAEEMAKYKSISSDLPDRIVSMAETDQNNQFNLRSKIIETVEKQELYSFKSYRLALILCFILCIFFISVAALFFWKGDKIVGGLFTAGAFIAIPKYFLGSRLKNNEGDSEGKKTQ